MGQNRHILLPRLGPAATCLMLIVSLHGGVLTQVASNAAAAAATGSNDEGPASKDNNNNIFPQKGTLEETVFAEMLRVVDQKFDSLSARMTVMERAVNSLNFYSVQQFRAITESLEVSTAVTEGLRGQVSKMDADDRALKAAVSQVARDINVIKTDVSILKNDVTDVKRDAKGARKDMEAMKTDSSRMFDDIANSIVYFNQNVEEKTEELESTFQGTVRDMSEKVRARIKEDTNHLIKYLEDVDLSRAFSNCSVNFRPLEERIDLRFAEMKRQTHSHFVDLINAGGESSEELEDGEESSQLSEEGGEAAEEDLVDPPATDDPLVRSSPGPENLQRPRGRLGYNRSKVDSGAGQGGAGGGGGGRGGGGGGGQRREGERVMRMLANMTTNVMDAVAYFRHTGSMMERLLASTESMAQEQTRLRYDVLEASGLLTPDDGEILFPKELVTNDLEVDHDQQGNNVPAFPTDDDDNELRTDSREQEITNVVEPVDSDRSNSNTQRRQLPFSSGPVTRTKLGHKPHASKFGATGSHGVGSRGGSPKSPGGLLGGGSVRGVAEESLKVLAELAKNGTQLLDVMTDLAQLSSTSLTKAVGSLHEEVVRLEDVRARFSEGLLLPAKAASGQGPNGGQSTTGEIRHLQNTTKTIFNIVEAIASNTGWIPYIFHNMQHVERLTNRTLELAKRSLLTMHWNRPHGNEIPQSQAQERRQGSAGSVTQAEALDVIYETNVKLQKIMPALTKLLAEPEALVALAGGKNSIEGRVEVFYKGQWGSVCQRSMGHKEASVVCRHLGYTGGIWAGDKTFGRGSGRQWLLNVTCVSSQQCPYVADANSTVDCPDGHFAVICDHMLKMTPLPGLNDVNTGMVTLSHQGRWLPVCGLGWSGYEARVACKQLGFRDGREFENTNTNWRQTVGDVTAWVSGVSCTGDEMRLDACKVKDFQASECPESSRPAAVRCQ